MRATFICELEKWQFSAKWLAARKVARMAMARKVARKKYLFLAVFCEVALKARIVAQSAEA